MRRLIVLTVVALSLVAGNAMAESIKGRLGLTGKLGFIVPLKDITNISDNIDREVKIGFAGGGGFIYGLGNNFALELDITHAPSMKLKEINGEKQGELQTTDISIGIQYRIMPSNRLVPYIGVGADFIKGDIAASTVDWTYGGHANIGVDYFINRSIAVTADFKGVSGFKGDILKNNVKVGKYDPMSFIGTFGVRLFLPEKW